MRRVWWILLLAGCLDDPKPKQMIGNCVGGIGGRSIRNTGRVGGILLNVQPGDGTWRSDAYSLGGATTISKLMWDPRAPYGRELAEDPPFDEGGVTLTNNVFLAHFSETSGNTFLDSSSSGLNLECPTPAICPAHGQGRFGGGVSFTGNGAVLAARRLFPSTLEPPQVTVEAWVRPTGATMNGDSTMMIVTKGRSMTAPFTQYSLEFDPNGNHSRCYAGLPLTSPLIGAATVALNQWTHMACSWDGSTLRLYTNGRLDNSVTVAGAIDYTDTHYSELELSVGRWGQNASQRMVGDIDEVAVWKEALPEAIIQSHYRRGALRLRLQVNTCDTLDGMGDCPGDFVGPDGTMATSYQEACAPDNENGVRVLPLTGYNCSGGNHDNGGSLNARSHIQYQALLDSDTDDDSPEVTDVQLCH